MKLIKTESHVLVLDNGTPVSHNQQLTTFRGSLVNITGGAPPHKPGSTGRVYTDQGGSYYPTVVGATWLPRYTDIPLDADLVADVHKRVTEARGTGQPNVSFHQFIQGVDAERITEAELNDLAYMDDRVDVWVEFQDGETVNTCWSQGEHE